MRLSTLVLLTATFVVSGYTAVNCTEQREVLDDEVRDVEGGGIVIVNYPFRFKGYEQTR